MPEFVDPNKILEKLNLPDNAVVVDFGSGSGGWAIPLAPKLEQGQIIAVDIQESALLALQSKAQLYSLNNIRRIIADVEEKISEINNESCNLVLITDLLFQIEDKVAVFKEAQRVLKPKGRILVVEWNPDSVFGPKDEKPSKQEVKEIAESIGFTLEKEIPAGDYHYGLVLAKE